MDATAIRKTIECVTKPWAKQRKAEQRSWQQEMRRKEKLCRQKARPSISLKDAVLQMIPEGAEECSGGGQTEYPARNLFYSVRHLIQRLTDASLKQKTFDRIVGAFEREHGLIPKMYRDPRGYLVEPHTGNMVPLGTREVDSYTFPDHLYDKILYVEKKGLAPIFKSAKLAEKYDMAIVCAEGYATRSVKTLFTGARNQRDMSLMCLHDADPHGYNIWRTLQESTESCPNHYVEIVDLGLNLEEGLDMGLEPEFFIRKKALPQKLEFNQVELDHFVGKEHRLSNGKRAWKARRIELNDVSKDPRKFIAWIEQKLADLGLAKKLVPHSKVVVDHARHEGQRILENQLRDLICDTMGVDAMVGDLASRFSAQIDAEGTPEELHRWAPRLEPEPWTEFIRGSVAAQARALNDDLEDAVRNSISKILKPTTD